MSRSIWFRVAAFVLAAYLWGRSISSYGGIGPVLDYAIAGTLTGLGLVWIVRAFASRPFRGRTALTSIVFGFFICTPTIAQLLGRGGDRSSPSVVVLALAAAAAAAMGGALWGVATLAGDAFGEWRHQRVASPLTLGGAHR